VTAKKVPHLNPGNHRRQRYLIQMNESQCGNAEMRQYFPIITLQHCCISAV